MILDTVNVFEGLLEDLYVRAFVFLSMPMRAFLVAQINFFFMDSLSFEEIACNDKAVGDRVDWLTEGSDVTLVYFNGKVIEVIMASPANYQVVETEPSKKGHTKPATLSCGAVINVPGFVEQGTMIRVDVDKGEYLERVK
jgi:elongation factor P